MTLILVTFLDSINGNGLETECEFERKKWKFFGKETLTCLLLSSIVIGLPIAIIIILMNLPKLSSRGDTRQQHYIILAFGLPFSLVFLVSISYLLYKCIVHCKRPDDHSEYFRTFSWRRFSRRLRSRRLRFTPHHQNRQHVNVNNEFNASPKLYSIVTQAMATQQQVFPQQQDVSLTLCCSYETVNHCEPSMTILMPETLIENNFVKFDRTEHHNNNKTIPSVI